MQLRGTWEGPHLRRAGATQVGVLCFAALSLISLGLAEEVKKGEPPAPQTKEELRQAIAKVLQEFQVAGASVVLVSKDEVLWEIEIGLADRATNRQVTSETMFRAGSISKSFIALAVLKLQEEGKLKQDDRVADLVGDIDFANPWEASDPLQLVHLLEHTSGFNEQSLREFAASVPDVRLHDSLLFESRARKSRWRPGRFFSYSNANYDLAGHIIERISGQSFDQYMEDEIFAPLNMNGASFLLTNAVRENLAVGHRSDGMTVVPYEHMLGRASGALNTTPAKLAHLVQLLLNRGTYQGVRLVSSESIDRMETPTTTLAARQGMRDGYGLGNSTLFSNGFRFHGHVGTRYGFVAQYAYAPEHGVGFVIMLNAGNREARGQVAELLLAYLTKGWPRPAVSSALVSEERLRELSGYYEPHTPRLEQDRFVDRLVGIMRVQADNGVIQISGLNGKPNSLVPASEHGFFRGEAEPAASAAFIWQDGELFLVSEGATKGNYRRISDWLAWWQYAVTLFCLGMMSSALLFALVWVPRKLLGYMRGANQLSVRFLPLLAVLCFVTMNVVGAIASQSEVQLGNANMMTVGICLLTWLFALVTVAGMVWVILARNGEIKPWVWRHTFLVSLANVIVLAYLAYWGIIGLRTWA